MYGYENIQKILKDNNIMLVEETMPDMPKMLFFKNEDICIIAIEKEISTVEKINLCAQALGYYFTSARNLLDASPEEYRSAVKRAKEWVNLYFDKSLQEES